MPLRECFKGSPRLPTRQWLSDSGSTLVAKIISLWSDGSGGTDHSYLKSWCRRGEVSLKIMPLLGDNNLKLEWNDVGWHDTSPISSSMIQLNPSLYERNVCQYLALQVFRTRIFFRHAMFATKKTAGCVVGTMEGTGWSGCQTRLSRWGMRS